MEIYVNGQRHRLTPSQAVGKGGEADVYKLDDRTVVKVFKQPDHPDVSGNPVEEDAARRRIAEHQVKLREFPKMPGTRVVSPIELATDRTGREVLGYTMEFLSGCEVLYKWSERPYREALKLGPAKVAQLFLGLHQTLSEIHSHAAVVGDFNDLNVLVRSNAEAWMIDADSFQWGRFLCKVFTERFVDPLLCDRKADRPMLVKPHNEMSDWYAFTVMFFRSLLYCDPYGGVHKPKRKVDEVLHSARPLHRINVFNKEVRYPRPAMPLDRLSDVHLDWFDMVFSQDKRMMFPEKLLKNFFWTTCTDCGTEHGRPTCPVCKKASPAAVKQMIQVRGKVTSTRIFKTTGDILHATWQGGELRYVYREGSKLFREGGKQVDVGPLPLNRLRIRRNLTLIGTHGKVFCVDEQWNESVIHVDSLGSTPVFDSNDHSRYWAEGGVLYRDGAYGGERIGSVLQGQTFFWVGARFGFGFYRAAQLSIAFVFDAERGRLDDSVKLPPMPGQIVDAGCYFSDDTAWFVVALKQGSRIVNRAVAVGRDGTVKGTAEADQGDGSWLGQTGGKCAAGKYLFSVTDDGLVRLECGGGTITRTAEFPDTEPFVDSGCHLFPGKDGLHVVDGSEIRLLKIA